MRPRGAGPDPDKFHPAGAGWGLDRALPPLSKALRRAYQGLRSPGDAPGNALHTPKPPGPSLGGAVKGGKGRRGLTNTPPHIPTEAGVGFGGLGAVPQRRARSRQILPYKRKIGPLQGYAPRN
jgi:hypothetical protein